MQSTPRMVSRACPVCLSDQSSRLFAESHFDLTRLNSFAFASRKVPEHMHFRLLHCRGCDVLYANPILPAETLAEAYLSAAYDSSEESHYAARTYARLVAPVVKQLSDTEGALDIGTGDGAFLEQMGALGFTGVIGVEPSEAPIRESKATIRPLIRHEEFEAQRFEESSFSLVTCFQTLEHVDDPLGTLRDVHSILKPGRAFVSVCHNFRSLSARVLGMKSPIFDIEHLQLFSRKGARRLLEEAGYTDIVVRTVINAYPLDYWLKLLPIPAPVNTRIRGALRTNGFGRRVVPLPAGNLAIVGFKP